MIKEQINIGILACFAARGRAKQIKVLDAELLQLGFVFPELGYGVTAVHFRILAQVWKFLRTGEKGRGAVAKIVRTAEYGVTRDGLKHHTLWLLNFLQQSPVRGGQ